MCSQTRCGGPSGSGPTPCTPGQIGDPALPSCSQALGVSGGGGPKDPPPPTSQAPCLGRFWLWEASEPAGRPGRTELGPAEPGRLGWGARGEGRLLRAGPPPADPRGAHRGSSSLRVRARPPLTCQTPWVEGSALSRGERLSGSWGRGRAQPRPGSEPPAPPRGVSLHRGRTHDGPRPGPRSRATRTGSSVRPLRRPGLGTEWFVGPRAWPSANAGASGRGCQASGPREDESRKTGCRALRRLLKRGRGSSGSWLEKGCFGREESGSWGNRGPARAGQGTDVPKGGHSSTGGQSARPLVGPWGRPSWEQD